MRFSIEIPDEMLRIPSPPPMSPDRVEPGVSPAASAEAMSGGPAPSSVAGGVAVASEPEASSAGAAETGIEVVSGSNAFAQTMDGGAAPG